MDTLKKFKEKAFNDKVKLRYAVKCKGCGEEIVFSEDEVTVERFEPKTVKAYKLRKPEDGETDEVEITVSSDCRKDVIRFECPVCGREIVTDRSGLRPVDYLGERTTEFRLTEKEHKDAVSFMAAHAGCCQKNLGKTAFSSTGGGFSYILTPTGLGNCVTVVCNSCGEKKDVTDSDSW